MPTDTYTEQPLAQLAEAGTPTLPGMTPDAARRISAAGAQLVGPSPAQLSEFLSATGRQA
jgi:hypothetical protein